MMRQQDKNDRATKWWHDYDMSARLNDTSTAYTKYTIKTLVNRVLL